MRKFIVNYLIELCLSLLVVATTVDSVKKVTFNARLDLFGWNTLVFGLVIISYLLFWYRFKSKKLTLNFVFYDEVNEIGVFVNKLIIPFVLYFSIILYSNFNFTSNIMWILYLAQFMTFFIYFLNVKSFFRKDTKKEQPTDVIYDIFKFLIFFMVVDVLLNLLQSNGINKNIGTIFIFFATLILSSMMLLRLKNIRKKYFGFVLIIATVMSVLYLAVVNLLNFNFLISSFVMLLGFYVSNAIMYHKIYKTLNKDVVFEFSAVILVVSVILIFLT